MSKLELTLNEKLDRAINSTNIKELKELINENAMIVRRAIARNLHISSDIADALAYDPVLNVSYMAVKNPRCTVKRNFENVSLVNCVICEKDERQLDCINCENKRKSSR